MSDEDERLFVEVCREHAVSSIRRIALLSIACTLLWMPADSLIYHRAQEDLFAVTLWRSAMVIVPIIVLLLLRSKRLRPYTLLMFVTCICACCGVLGYSAGVMGQLDEPWFHLYNVGFFISVLMPLRLGQRAVFTLLFAISLWLGLLLPFPENLSSRYLPLSLAFQLNMYVLSVVFGHGLFMLNRQAFQQSRIILRNSAALESYSATLEERVNERTHELGQLLNHVEAARETERAHISRELHDELGQQLAALGYEVTALQRRYAADPLRLDHSIEDLAAALEHARGTVRTLVTDLRPRVLDDLGLCAAVEWLVARVEERSELRCQLTMTGEEVPLSAELASAAFRIVQESLTNVVRHAEASSVSVTLCITPKEVELRIEDDGKGLPPAGSPQGAGVGLIGMRERASRLGGSFALSPRPSGGTAVHCVLPGGAAGSS